MSGFHDNVFKKDGDKIEGYVLNWIKTKYPKAYNNNIDGIKLEDWDIFIPEKGYGIEIKGDFESLKTGNIVVEVANKDGELSALSKTKARYWIFVTGIRYIIITPLSIYRFIEQHPEYHSGKMTIKGNGDDYRKSVYLINHDDFVRYVYDLDDVDGYVKMIDEKNPLHVTNFKRSKYE